MDFVEAQQITAQLREKIGRVVIGQEEVVEGLLVALLSGGHALLEGPPGSAKTLLARCFAHCLGLVFKRVQFTPDLMPGDLIGTNLYNFQTNAFTLTRGPIFTDFLLADEINRTPPKTQAALLQAMQESTVTLDGENYSLSDSFLVVATQNPIEHEGTYPLPEAQLDRFLLKIDVPFPQRDDEIAVVRLHGHRSTMPKLSEFDLEPVAGPRSLLELRKLVQRVTLSDEMVTYVVDLIRATREHPAILHGASPRAATMLATAARALATLRGREFAIPDDVKELFLPTLHHRIVLAPSAEVEGQTADGILKLVLESVAAPR